MRKRFSLSSRMMEIVCALIFAAIAVLPALIIALLRSEASPYQDQPQILVYLNVTVVAPIVETLLFQLLPFHIAQSRRWTGSARVSAMIIPFAIAHESGGYIAVANAAFGGSILTLTFHIWAARSIQSAVFMTFFVHAAANAMAFIGDYFLAASV